ncbi:MAG: DMP19 family protein [Opitutaceae bacterium]|nr:DMP19 family protein [Opitutaceae bacterium]
MNTDLAAQRALDRLAKAGFEKLSAQDKILATVWTFEAGVANHGFAQYFSSSAGDMAFYAPAAFKAIGAVDMAGIAAKANEAFGPGGPPKDRKTRRELVRAFDDETRKRFTALETSYYESKEDADDLLESYINKQ